MIASSPLTLLGGFAWYERSRPPLADRRPGRRAGGALRRRPGRLLADPERRPHHRHHPDRGLRARRGAGVRRRRAHRAGLQLLARTGAVDAVADGGLGADGLLGAGARGGRRAAGSAGSASPRSARLAGFAYGALLDFSVMVSYGGEQSLDRYLAISARGLPFNIAHAAGNAALALVAGPGHGADARPLSPPLRVRLEARRRGPRRGRDRRAACLVVALLIALPPSSVARGPTPPAAAPRPRSPGCAGARTATAASASPAERRRARR